VSLLVVNTSESWGGNEHWAVQVAAGLAARGRRVRFVWSHEAVGAPVRDAGLEHQRILFRNDGDLPRVLALREAVVETGARALLATRWREYLHCGLVARLAGRPRVVIRLGLDVLPRADLKRRLIFRLADRVLVNAPQIRETLLRRPWIEPERVNVVLNGLDLLSWRPRWEPAAAAAGQSVRRELGLDPEAPLLLAVGAFSPQKDFGGLLEAMALLEPAHPELRLLLVGDGFLRDELLDRRRRLGLDGKVLMTGFRRDVAAVMAAADLHVLSSRNEGMARVLSEAAASGLPAVATDVSGSRLAVAHGESGLIVPPEDPPALAAAVAELLDAPQRRDDMGRRARCLAEERFDARRMIDETEAVLFG